MPSLRFPIRVITIKALQAAALAKSAVDATVRVLDRESKIVERAAKKRAPTAFGILRSKVGTVGPKRGAGQETFGTSQIPQTQFGLFGSGVFFEVGVRGLGRIPQYVEFGTGPAGAASPHTALAQQAMAELGYKHGSGNFLPPIDEIEKWVRRKKLPLDLVFPIARAIGRKGLRAQPFLIPSFEERRPGIPGRVAAAVARVLGRGA